MNRDTFNTVQLPAQGLYKEKGSKFISFIYPLLQEKEVRMRIDELRKSHPKARHICYAYRFGPDPDYHRHQDDGEPTGTAGLPILGQLKSHELQNVLIAVVRYFGGVLLGVSGLTSAYKLAALDAIQQATIIPCTRWTYFTLNYGYSLDKKFKFWLKSIEGKIVEQNFTDQVFCKIAVPKSMEALFQQRLNEEAVHQQWHETLACTWVGSDLF